MAIYLSMKRRMKTINLELSGEIMMEGIEVEYYQSLIKPLKNGCWFFLGFKNKAGYGKVFKRGKYYTAHRFYYEAFYKTILDNRMFACHSCDNPSCVNPSHIWFGSPADNMKDMKEKGRSLVGEESPRSKLKEHQVKEIIKLKGKIKQTVLARRFGVQPPAINKIYKGTRWPHLHRT